jgi:hypothetical protein
MATGKEIRAKLKEEARERARLESMEERQAKVAAPGSEGYKPTKTDMGPNMSQVNKPDSKKATTKATTKTPIVTKKQLEDSGFTNLRDYLNNKKGLTRRDGAAPERTNNKPESTTKSQDAKPNKSNTPKPDYSNKTKAKTKTSMVDKSKSLVGADREPTAKEAMGRNQMNAARKSMGFEKGGKVKGGGLRRGRMVEEKPKRPPEAAAYKGMNKAPASMSRAGVAKMPGMKHGGSVGGTSMGKVRTAKPRNINGIAKRGLTRAKHR